MWRWSVLGVSRSRDNFTPICFPAVKQGLTQEKEAEKNLIRMSSMSGSVADNVFSVRLARRGFLFTWAVSLGSDSLFGVFYLLWFTWVCRSRSSIRFLVSGPLAPNTLFFICTNLSLPSIFGLCWLLLCISDVGSDKCSSNMKQKQMSGSQWCNLFQ